MNWKPFAPLALAIAMSSGAHASNMIRMQAPIAKYPGAWEVIDPVHSDWIATSELYGCTGATPATTAYTKGQDFQQTQTGCSQDFSRTLQAREQNDTTGDIRNKGVATTESKTESNLSYAKTATGTRDDMEILYGAGTGTRGGAGRFAGIYARKNELDIGTVMMVEAGRVLAYFFRNSGSTPCEFRFATTGPEGWVTAGATTTAAMTAYTNQAKKAELYLANGTKYATYTLGSATSSAEGGSIKQAAVPCAVVDTFYNNPSYFSKVVLLKQ